MTRNVVRRGGIALLLFVACAANRATAGPVYLYFALSPITTAGAGIPTVARQFSTGSFSVTSTQSGFGRWHLYALDDIQGSLGIAGFSVPVSDSSGILNRSTNATFTNYGDADETVVESSGSAGFSDVLVRSGQGVNPSNPVQGNQVIGSANDIPGMGQTAGNLNSTPALDAPGDHRVWGGVTSGTWGNYATTPTLAYLANSNYPASATAAATKKWVLLGEGTYTGFQPFIGANTAINVYTSSQGGVLSFTPVTPAMGGVVQVYIIPEPASFALVGLAAAACFGVARRRKA